MRKHRVVIGIDPSISKGQAFSVWKDNKLKTCGKFHSLIQWVAILNREEPDLILIEDQYLAINYKTSKELSLMTGKLMGIAELLNKKVEIVNVATWQSRLGVLTIGRSCKLSERRKLKMAALITLAGKFIKLDDDDIAAAVLIPYAMRYDE